MEKDKNIKPLRKFLPSPMLALAIAVVALSLASLSFERIARSVWRDYDRPLLALALTRDAAFSMSIGNYYFGGSDIYDLEIALRAYQRAVTIDPNVPWGHYQLSRIYFMRRAYDDALRELELAAASNPEDQRWRYIRGLIYAFRGLPDDLERSAEDFRRFTEWMPGEWAGHNDLAWVLAKAGQYRESRETIRIAFKKAADADTNPWLWNALGVAELNLGNAITAGATFRRAGELAAGLTDEDWRRAYPGNDPANASAGIAAFREAIAENLRRAPRAGVDKER